MKQRTNEKGITLIALVITIIILLILAGISINLIFGQNGVIERAKWSAFVTKLSSIEEQAMLTRNITPESYRTIDYNNTEVFDGLYDEENISNTLKKAIAEVRENDPQISQEDAISKYETYKDESGKITDIYYISKRIGDESHKYIYDSQTNKAFHVKGEKIFGKINHYYKPGEGNTGTKDEDTYPAEPDDPDMPEPEPLQEGEIPIYTVEQYEKIASEEQNYEIKDLNGTLVGYYNMNKDATYKVMNDIDFKDRTTISIAGFQGTFNGNSYVLKNITIDNKSAESTYKYYSTDNLKTGDVSSIEVGKPTGLFERTIGATIKNVKIDNAAISGSANAGTIAGEIVETTIEKCIIENSTVLSDAEKGKGTVGGIVGWVYKQNTSTIKQVKVDNISVEGSSITSGLIGMSTSPIEIEGCKLKNSTINYKNSNVNYGTQAGILANSYDNATITNCYVGKTTFKNDLTAMPGASSYDKTCAGILGVAGWNYNDSKYTIQVTGSSIVDTKLAWGNNVGGICGSIGSSVTTLNLENCNAKNIETGTGTAVGGILGYTYSKATTIKNCDVDGFNGKGTFYNNTSQNLGGIVGYLYTGTVDIQDCDSKNLKFELDGAPVGQKQIAGIVGASYGGGSWGSDKNGKITNCTVSNSEMKYNVDESKISFSSNVHICGIVGYNSLDFENCIVSKTKMLILTDNENLDGQDTKYWYNGVEGICGTSGCARTIANCKVLDTQMENEVGQVHGICAYSYSGTTTISTFTLENSNIYSLNFAAGGFGYMNAVILDGFTAKNTNITSEAFHAAGVTTYAIGNYNSEYKNINIEGCNIGNTKRYASEKYSDTSYYGSVAGVASINSGGVIKNAKVINTTLTNHSRNTGGIIGYATYSSSNPISYCEVKNITINSEGRDVGGIIGNSGGQAIENCSVDGGTINSTREGVGGIAGQATGNIKDCTVKNINITTSQGMVGGIVGCMPIYNSTVGINNCDIEKVNINSSGILVGGIAGYYSKGYITGCDVTSSKIISTNYNVGGIAGIACDMANNIENCNVNLSEISGKDSNVGGIVGQYISTTADTKISGCTVKDSKVTETGADAVSVGGIVGNGYNFYTDKLTPYTNIESCIVSNTTITGIDNVGGINGAVATSITGCTVDGNTTITGRNNVGGIQGYSGTLGSITGSYGSYGSSTETLQNNSYSGTAGDYGNIESSSVSNSTIKGNNNVNYIRGCNVGTTKETSCTYESVNINP